MYSKETKIPVFLDDVQQNTYEKNFNILPMNWLVWKIN